MKTSAIEKGLLKTFLGLLGLTVLTTLIAYVDLGIMNFPAALLIAGWKASLVALFFMHTRKAEILVKLFAGGTLVWLVLLLGLTFTDYISRGWLVNPSFWGP